MKYSLQLRIDRPRDEVAALFTDPDNLKHWQPGLVGREHISGTPGQTGAKTRIRHCTGRKEVTMLETITDNRLPDILEATYESNGVWNRVTNHFIPVKNNHTRWVFEIEFRGTGIIRVMMWLMPGAFKKQSRTYMERFKSFAEKPS
jgi:uncharacterized protein YndB with AHSA1/START domain